MTVAGRGSQAKVWNEVANAQRNISQTVTVDVTANASASSLQLSLENKKLKKATEEFVKKFSDLTKGKSDVIGYAFAINGKINSADIYLSNHLFAKVWPKMLRAAVIEAISLDDKPKADNRTDRRRHQQLPRRSRPRSKEGTPDRCKIKGHYSRRRKMKLFTKRADKADLVVHRNYVKLN